MHRRTAEKVEKENLSTHSRNSKVSTTAVKITKNDVHTKGHLTAGNKATIASSHQSAVKLIKYWRIKM